MNYRIEALLELATQSVADEHTKGDVSRLNTDSYTVQNQIQQRFTEAIVWECFSIGAKYIQTNDDVSKFERDLKNTFRGEQ